MLHLHQEPSQSLQAEPGCQVLNSTPEQSGLTLKDPTSGGALTNMELLTYLQSISTPHFNLAIRSYSLEQLVGDGTLIDDAYTKWAKTTIPERKLSKKKNKLKTLIPESNGNKPRLRDSHLDLEIETLKENSHLILNLDSQFCCENSHSHSQLSFSNSQKFETSRLNLVDFSGNFSNISLQF